MVFTMRFLGFSLMLLTWAAMATASQDLSKPVEYTTRAKPLKSVLFDLSKQTGVELECVPALENEPLILRLHSVPLKEAMDKIAAAFGGHWKNIDKAYEFEWGAEAETRHELALQARADLIKESYKALLEDSAKIPVIETQAQADDFLDKYIQSTKGGVHSDPAANSPVAKLADEVAAKLNPAQLAAIPEWTNRVFATDPSPLEQPIEGVQEPIDEFSKSQALLMDSKSNKSTDIGIGWAIGRPGVPPFKVLASVFHAEANSYGANVMVADSTGTVVANRYVRLGKEFDFIAHRKNEQKVRLAHRSEGVTLGPIAAELVNYIVPDKTKNELTPAARTALTNCTETDPLSIASSDILLGFAQQDNVNAVCLPTDYGETWSYIASRGGYCTLDLYQKVLARSDDMVADEQDGWLIARPVDPLDAASTRMPRPALEKFLKAAAPIGHAGIDEIAGLICSIPDGAKMILANYGLQCLTDQQQILPFHRQYAVYGFLDDQQRSAAKQGKLRLPRTQWSTDLTAAISSWLVNGDDLFKEPGFDEKLRERERESLPTPDLHGELIWQPTEILSGNLPADTALTVTDTSTPVYFFKGTGLSGLRDLGDSVAASERPDLNPDMAAFKSNLIATGATRSVVITVTVSGYEASTHLDDHVKPTGKGLTPAEFLESLSPADQARYMKGYQDRATADKAQTSPGTPPTRA